MSSSTSTVSIHVKTGVVSDQGAKSLVMSEVKGPVGTGILVNDSSGHYHDAAENIKIYLRIRPFGANTTTETADNLSGISAGKVNASCLVVDAANQNPPSVSIVAGPKVDTFLYDFVGGPQAQQDEIFETVGQPVTDYCLQGYNGTIFAYGQTGSGKTFTMQGPMTEEGLIDYRQRGLIPRTFEYLFEKIREAEERFALMNEEGPAERQFLCKCTYVEIYNETIFDLLDIGAAGGGNICTLREDIKRGVYIDGAREEMVASAAEAYEVYERGSLNRHTAETSMNRESSRSHSVFTLFIQSKQRVGEITDVRESRFNLVDLAGSERQQLTGTTGLRLKEAGNINKSLLALSNVINGLVDIANGKARHVQYRDSRLTFLLRDSLGGNAKTFIIANVSPNAVYYNETLSTLKFAQRAKLIKNKAIVNKDIQGNVLQLQAEIRRLQHELYLTRNAVGASLSNDSFSSAMQIDSGSGMMTMRPSGSGHSLGGSKDLDPAEAYLMLTMALERQAESVDEIESLHSKINLMEELMKRKEHQNQAYKMLLRFRDHKITQLRHCPQESSEADESERAHLKQEIQELRKIIEHHPEVTRFAYENLQLREKIHKYEALEKRWDEFEATIARHKQYEQLLTNRILTLEKRGEEAASGTGEDGLTMQSIDVSWREQEEQLKLQVKELEERAALANRDASDYRMRYEDKCQEAQHLVHQLQEAKAFIEALPPKKSTSNLAVETDPLPNNEGPLRCRISELEQHLEALNVDLSQSESKRQRLDRDAQSQLGHLQGQLDTEKKSVARLVQEKESLQGQIEQGQRALEREKERTRMLLEDFELAKNQFTQKLEEINDEMERFKNESEIGKAKSRSAVAEKELIQQELQVTRQILAEYKTRCNTASGAVNTFDEDMSTNLNKIMELETEVADLKKKLASVESNAAQLSGSEERTRILQAENGQLQVKIGRLEFLLRNAQADNDELIQQVQKRNDEQNLMSESMMIKSQLDSANHTVETLRTALTAAEYNIDQLRLENDKLVQHHNLKQKLQYHVKIKQENNDLKEELQAVRDELGRLRERNEVAESTLESVRKNLGEERSADKLVAAVKKLVVPR